MFLNPIAILTAIHLVVPVTWALESFPEKIPRVINEEPIELPTHKVYNWYPDTIKAVVEGKGSTIRRGEVLLEKLKAVVNPGERMKSILGWNEALNPEELPPYLSQRDYGNPKLVVFKKNDFPWDLPEDVEHYVVWIRSPLVTKEAFKRLEHDPPYPNREYEDIDGPRVAALVEYLNQHNMNGRTGLPPLAVSPFRHLSLRHPTEEHLWESDSGEVITRQEAIQAMRWVARHTEKLIELEFPASIYETVWSRTRKPLRSIKDPNHFHILVIPKSLPDSFFNLNLNAKANNQSPGLRGRKRRHRRRGV
ncbi:hypothetical protein PCANC_24315 [Puccinia coronata f. sp. avenae]|uniref:Uncharacterized protein n=2 Tax=Puccinia coronata f. sp. avenae TaxID=200324 RepID=A0A2N5TPN1_9BASI|nr:hypothetical protein PCANC_26525 [Puccinia coronata f. sp. avenae]PLW27431.1 hypothetical protein PCANC_24315 [Puccinia coronata f. sp. avenae]